MNTAGAAQLSARIGSTVCDDAGPQLASRLSVRAVDAERLIHVAVSCRAAIQQRSAGNRSRTARHLAALERVRGQRTCGDHRKPALDAANVHTSFKIRRSNSHVSSVLWLKAHGSRLPAMLKS